VVAAVGAYAVFSLLYLRFRDRNFPSANGNRFFSLGCFFFFGWVVNLLPYVLVERTTFIYHYLPGLLYGQMLIGLSVDFYFSKFPKVRGLVAMAVLLVIIVVWGYFGGWVYAYPLSPQAQFARKNILKGW